MRILHNAKIRTLNPEQPFAAALAVENGRILAVGGNEDVLSLANRSTQIEDLHGQTLWPGLTDAHLHLEAYAASLERVDCETATKEECLRRIAQRARSTPAGMWIQGHGFNQNLWPEGYGTADELDAAAGDHPVYISAKSLHAGWANHLALRLAGVDHDTQDIDGGRIQRDRDGEPDGILLENAVRFVERILPIADEMDTARAIGRAQEKLWSMGLTGVHDNDRRRCFQALQWLDQQNQLRLRVVKNLPFELLPEAITLGLRSGFGGDFLRIGSIKMFADGALGPQTAALLEPYENSASTGVLQLNATQVFEAGRRAAESGLSLAIHAIGDRANREILDGYAMLRSFEEQNHLPPLRHRIEHVQLLAAADLRRLAELNLIASVQPIHATSDMDMADRYWGSRTRNAYAYRTLLETGTCLAFGSDAPVESPNPFLGLHAAVNRTRSTGYPDPEGWHSEQRISLASALEAYTLGPAVAAGRERESGRLTPGTFADLILLAEDPFELPSESLYGLQPEATMVAGEWVYRH